MRIFLTVLLSSIFIASYAMAQDVTIYDVQFTDDPSGNSPLEGDTILTGGVVTGVSYTGQPIRYFVSDPEGGQWHGILVVDNQNRNLSIGDSILFEAKVEESSSQTRLRTITSGYFAFGQQTDLVAPFNMASGDIAEAAEGVLIELTNAVVVSIGGADFTVDDGSGTITIGQGWSYSYDPLVGDTLRYIRGIVTQSGSVFTLNPRDDADFGFFGNRPPLFSDIRNVPEFPTEQQSDTVSAIITDDSAVDSAKVFYRFGESGEYSARIMYDDGTHGDAAAGDSRWTGVVPAGPARTTCYYYIFAMDDQGGISTSPADAPLHTHSYAIRSSVVTIYDLQYTGDPTGGDSPYFDSLVTVTGIVTGTQYDRTYLDGFYISDPGGGLWAGVQAFNPGLTPVQGDCVRVTGFITEFSGLTEFDDGAQVTILGQGVIPEPLPLRIGLMQDSAEAYEGTLAQIGPCVVINTDAWLQYQQFNIRDSTGTGTAVGGFTFEYVPTVGDSFTFITGCVTYNSNPKWMIAPRSDADIGFVDRRPPVLDSIRAVTDTSANVIFNEVLSSEGLSDPEHYHISDQTDLVDLHVTSAYLFSSGRIIQVSTLESLIEDHRYRLSIDTVRDLAGNALLGAVGFFDGYQTGEYTAIRDIYDHLDIYENTSVTLRGVVNFVQDVTTTSGSRRISAFMQDESGYGFNLSQTGAAALFPGIQRGNLIVIHGIVSVFSGAIQLGSFNGDPTTGDVEVLAENYPLPAPRIIQTGDRRLQGELIRTSSPDIYGSGTWVQTTGRIYTVDENIGGGTNITIDDGTGQVIIRVWDSMNLDSVNLNGQWLRLRDLVNVICSVAGPASAFEGDFQMLAGYAEDFTVPSPDSLPPGLSSDRFFLELQNRPFAPDLGQKLKISFGGPGRGQLRLRVYDLRGRLVTTLVDKETGGPNEIWWDGTDELRNWLPLGTYILHLESDLNGSSKTMTKPIVIGTKL